jgi:hypothetical protein
MFHPHVVDEGNSFQIQKGAVSILNVQLQTVIKELSSNMEAGSLCHRKIASYEMLHRASELKIS